MKFGITLQLTLRIRLINDTILKWITNILVWLWWDITFSYTSIVSFPDPLTTPNAVYGIVVKCSDDTTTADNPVYGARIDTTMKTCWLVHCGSFDLHQVYRLSGQLNAICSVWSMLVLISQEVHMYALLDHTMMNEKGLHYKCWSDLLVTFNVLSIFMLTTCMGIY